MYLKSVELWCERRDSNSHALRHWNLNPARLPIPPLSRIITTPVFPTNSLQAHRKGGDYTQQFETCITKMRGDGVNDGARTHDNRNHNPGLYQLSYIHH